MKIKTIPALLFLLSVIVAQGKNLQEKFDKAAFYAAMDSGNADAINTQLAVVSSLSFNGKEGYEGALWMRKAALVTRPAEKLRDFKIGRIQLEAALLNDSNNAEFHFLRFAIQEHAPDIVKYRADIYTDKEFILKAYKNLPPVVQRAIIDYTKSSKLLHTQDFNL